LAFGYSGVDFGLLYRTGGLLETQVLTLSAAATGAETFTITLNGTEFTTSATAGTIPHNAFEIVSDTFTGYETYQNGNTVTFVATAIGAQTGDFTFASDGDGAGSFAESVAGNPVTDTFVNQADWNIDPMDGEGPSGMTLDPSKGNVYQVEYQYLGYGQILYSIEDFRDGQPTPVHRIQYVNSNVSPSLTQPILKIGWFAASVGSSGTNLECYGGSAGAFVEGKITPFRNPQAHGNTKTGITTALTSVISFRVRAVFNNIINVTETKPLLASVAVDGTKPAQIAVIINPTLGGEPNWQYHDESDDTMEFDTAATTVTGGREAVLFSLPKSGGETIDMNDLGFILTRGDIITLAVQATSGTTDASASLTWLED
jgi:hypothetical protein